MMKAKLIRGWLGGKARSIAPLASQAARQYGLDMDAFCVCPYCGQSVDFWLDETAGRSQHYVEDCAVCCRPIELHVTVDEDGEPSLHVARTDD